MFFKTRKSLIYWNENNDVFGVSFSLDRHSNIHFNKLLQLDNGDDKSFNQRLTEIQNAVTNVADSQTVVVPYFKSSLFFELFLPVAVKEKNVESFLINELPNKLPISLDNFKYIYRIKKVDDSVKVLVCLVKLEEWNNAIETLIKAGVKADYVVDILFAFEEFKVTNHSLNSNMVFSYDELSNSSSITLNNNEFIENRKNYIELDNVKDSTNIEFIIDYINKVDKKSNIKNGTLKELHPKRLTGYKVTLSIVLVVLLILTSWVYARKMHYDNIVYSDLETQYIELTEIEKNLQKKNLKFEKNNKIVKEALSSVPSGITPLNYFNFLSEHLPSNSFIKSFYITGDQITLTIETRDTKASFLEKFYASKEFKIESNRKRLNSNGTLDVYLTLKDIPQKNE